MKQWKNFQYTFELDLIALKVTVLTDSGLNVILWLLGKFAVKSGQHLNMLENSSPGKPWTSGSSFVMNQLREYGIYVLLLTLIHCLQIF